MGSAYDYPEDMFFSTYKALSENLPYHVLLESGQRGRYSIAAFHPFAVFSAKNHCLYIETEEGSSQREGDPLDEMKKWLAPFEVETNADIPDFQGGLVGYISYDYIRYIEDLPQATEDDLDTRDLYFLAFQNVFVYDHVYKKLWIIVHYDKQMSAEAKREWYDLKKMWDYPPTFTWEQRPVEKDVLAAKPSFSREGFGEAIGRVQEYIRAGDAFQVNLSVRQSKQVNTPPLHIYEKLRELNPSPYMGYFHTPDLQLVSGSPELLIKKRGDEASTRPIAGTRPRGDTEQKDSYYEQEMMGTEKERAEHVMLVDLERNDLGKVCTYGSVEVDELMVVERYSHVMHIVSNVKGKLADNVDVYDMIKAAFPGGTITGAPKIRTMEIIEELEPVRRGVYTGSLGWIGFNKDMELNISIRTMVINDDIAYVQAGAGIVIDSIPDAEYEESLKKARALWKAKEISEEEMALKKSRAEEE
ncbi:anthranilate synthase component I family protein [Salibacterium salarium]|uniref:Anthranilate synthase component I family protein n=1 Tax=Salibacterium salarium TaxID=284579 RepID=A0A3R9WN96_9BACI|nr:anthranilate synthase component I family protein [Salibacterium salarium]RSL30068.1 anthranilate synthase component I family protein [Salibacterium salarium]